MKSNTSILRLVIFALILPIIIVNLNHCSPTEPKFRQYLVEGERLYLAHCGNCHQADGKGLRKVYPPLAGSDYLVQNFEKVICAMKYGLQGEILVNGNSYRQPMPGVPSLTELELAEIATYIYVTWGHQKRLIEVKDIGPLLDSCKPVRPYHE